jgi:8-oxo-dGTP pyrophosphatase MutT (NUDIX family)
MIRHFVTACYPVLDGKVAMVFHKKLRTWLPPGGHIDENEIPSEAAIREVKEETNLDVEIISDLRGTFGDDHVMEEPLPFRIQIEDIPDKKIGLHQHIDLVYVARVKRDSLRISHESEDIGWFSKEELLALDGIFENTRQLGLIALGIAGEG